MTTQPSIESLRAGLEHLPLEAQDRIIALRAENEALRQIQLIFTGRDLLAENEALKQWHDQHEEREAACCPEDIGCIEFIRYLKDSLTAAEARAEKLERELEDQGQTLHACAGAENAERARADAAEARNVELGARVEALTVALRKYGEHKDRCNLSACVCGLSSTLNSTPAADLEAHDAKVREPLEDVLRTLASWLGNGGYNAPSPIDPAQFEAKIRDGVECELKMAKVLALSGARTRAFNFWNNGRHSGYLDLYAAIEDKPNHPVEEGLISAHDERVRREEREAAAKKCAEAYWAMVAPKDHAAMHPTIEFWRDALGLEPMSSAEHEALAAIEPRHPEIVMVDDLALLVRLLVHSIRKHSPDNKTARKAMDYLRRHELQGSPLRTTILSPAPDAAKPNNQQEQP